MEPRPDSNCLGKYGQQADDAPRREMASAMCINGLPVGTALARVAVSGLHWPKFVRCHPECAMRLNVKPPGDYKSARGHA
jgi:hypothetical protein